MQRRELLKLAAAAGGLGLASERHTRAQDKAERATRGMPSPMIKDIQVIATQPSAPRLTVVKVITDQAGLYGYGCGTFWMRAELVNVAVDRYLKPLLVGKPANRIDDIWQMCQNSAQWRFGPVLNNAMSGVDEALWDIKGRQAGMPVYELLGGKCREAAETYVGLDDVEPAKAIEGARKAREQGFRNFRAFGTRTAGPPPTGLREAFEVFDPALALRAGLKMLEECRKHLGEEVGLLYDVHRRATPNQAVQFAKDVEPLKLFFLEDPLSNEMIPYYRQIRQQCSTPIAMGELFTNNNEWVPLIAERLIDYMRMHVSALGGVTPCRKAAAMGEIMGVRTAWHGSPDISPIGHMANVHLDLACYNFGIQEYRGFDDRTREVFKGCPIVKNGYMYANDAPGWGMEVDEKAAAKYPYGTNEEGIKKLLNGGWSDYRLPDGTIFVP
jgi:mannonate dehydratase